MVYLYYYDSDSKELGHEFDIPETTVRPNTKSRISFILSPPEDYSYTVIELKAEMKTKENHLLNAIGLVECHRSVLNL